MALVPEDDTGLANADCYVSLVAFRAYWTNRNTDTSAITDPQAEAAIRKAAAFIDSKWEYNAQVLVPTQALEFPRSNLDDGHGRIFNTVPRRVKDANCELALIQANGTDLYGIFERGGQITSESVSGLSTSYAADADPGMLFEAAERLLSPYVLNKAIPRRMLPIFGTSDEIAFERGQFDIPGTGSDGEV